MHQMHRVPTQPTPLTREFYDTLDALLVISDHPEELSAQD